MFSDGCFTEIVLRYSSNIMFGIIDVSSLLLVYLITTTEGFT